jgi:glutamine amidotransferase
VIALIDYGAGNLTSVKKALTFLGADFVVPESPAELREARGVIVPGVGHFAATAALEGAWFDAIAAETRGGKPLLGICLGMQWLFEGSDEAPDVRGLGVMQGRITRLQGDAERQLKIPHVGWNALEFREERPGHPPARLLAGLASGAQVYFTHSYAAPITDATVAATTHRDAFASAVERGHVFGVQFHPEKSSDAGLQMIRNFLGVCGR